MSGSTVADSLVSIKASITDTSALMGLSQGEFLCEPMRPVASTADVPTPSLDSSTERLIGVVGLASQAGVSVADFIKSVSDELTEQTVFEDWP